MCNSGLPVDRGAWLDARVEARDREGRAHAVDPRFSVVLEASAGTGKTRVLVDRYVNLLRAGIDPGNVLAITFTRKAAAEMRERVLSTLRDAASRGEIPPAEWRDLRERMGDAAIGTIDAFCLSLLREFPLEADLDPGFAVADETELPHLIDESLDRALRIGRALACSDDRVALVFSQLTEWQVRSGLGSLLDRRLVARDILSRYLVSAPEDLDLATVTRRATGALLEVFGAMPGGLDRLIETGPPEPGFVLLAKGLIALERGVRAGELDPAAVSGIFARAREHFLRQDGHLRSALKYGKARFATEADWRAHRTLVTDHGEAVRNVLLSFRRDLNVLVSRGVWRLFEIADEEYRRTLDAHALLDFSDVLRHTLRLLGQMEEFSQSRFRLESRYHHVLVDEFQDTSRAQWDLVELLVQSWGEGAGLAGSGPLEPSIFIVGDRKQSIYGFRDADVSVFQDATRFLEALRPGSDVRKSISRSHRSVPALLAFVNDVCADIEKTPARSDGFRYDEQDRFPLGDQIAGQDEALGLVLAMSSRACAELTAAEISRLLSDRVPVRDRDTGLARPIRPGDIAILFRSRQSHREFEEALERRGITAYVYKGLGFFDADEVKDVLALIWYLADPTSDLRAAAFLRSRLVGLSDEGLRTLAPHLAASLSADVASGALPALDSADALRLEGSRHACRRWLPLVDRLPPSELLDLILSESSYAVELRGPRLRQASENLKKVRALVRRIQNRGYATFARIAEHVDRLALGDESNAVVDAVDAVSLMTIHASKGLEFPVVFVVNLARGTGGRRDPIRVRLSPSDRTPAVEVGDFQDEREGVEPPTDEEETKRLVYVAFTRARDRLYLGSSVEEENIRPARGSLAEVLPPVLLSRFVTGQTSGAVQWRASSGKVHSFRLCTDAHQPASTRAEAPVTLPCDFVPLLDRTVQRRTVGEMVGGGALPPGTFLGPRSDSLAGTVVHRLLQRVGLDHGLSADELRGLVPGLLRPGEGDEVPEMEEWADGVAAVCRALSSRPDVRAAYGSGERWHEVPFTMREGSGIVRGTIDCLVRTGAGGVTILEFKTGRRRPEHLEQVELYGRAAGALFPGVAVDALLVYSEAAWPLEGAQGA
jgi:ATP-dependent helicase/nuclease subunit A